MAKKDYKKLSDDIIAAVGGVENIRSASHCMTRLRLNLVDASKLNIDEAMPIAMQLGIMSIPTIMVVKNGEITFKEAGLMQKAQLEALL